MTTLKQIQNCVSYERYSKVAGKLHGLKLPKKNLGKTIQVIHDDIMEQYSGYRSATASRYAQ